MVDQRWVFLALFATSSCNSSVHDDPSGALEPDGGVPIDDAMPDVPDNPDNPDAPDNPDPDTANLTTPPYDDPVADVVLGPLTTTPVSTAAQLTAALAGSCGQLITLAPGTYSGTFNAAKTCTATTPIIVKGAAGHTSVITGGLFTLSGSHQYIDGVKFTRSTGTQVKLIGTRNKLLRSELTNWGFPMAVDAGGAGKQGEIAYNFFHAPADWEHTNNDLRIAIRTSAGTAGADNFHFDMWVHHNHFFDFPPKPIPTNYSSGQNDAMEICETNVRAFTATLRTGWYVESNLVEDHLQGHGTFDAKCGGNVFRDNTFLGTKGRIDLRSGTAVGNIVESNWLDGDSNCMELHGAKNIIVGNRCEAASFGIRAGDHACDVHNATGSGHSASCGALVAGNVGNLVVGRRASSEDDFFIPAKDTTIEQHDCARISFGTFVDGSPAQADTVNNCAQPTSYVFAPAVKRSRSDVGPAAFASAPAAYREARVAP